VPCFNAAWTRTTSWLLQQTAHVVLELLEGFKTRCPCRRPTVAAPACADSTHRPRPCTLLQALGEREEQLEKKKLLLERKINDEVCPLAATELPA
jgi:hypothetical protein